MADGGRWAWGEGECGERAKRAGVRGDWGSVFQIPVEKSSGRNLVSEIFAPAARHTVRISNRKVISKLL